jgi:hypothetical protein
VGSDRVVRIAQRGERRQAAVGERSVGAWSAGIALALVYPFMRRARRTKAKEAQDGALSPPLGGDEGNDMRKKPSIKSLETVTYEEAQAYLEYARGDELNAAHALACDRNRLDGSIAAPDHAEVHHALFLLCRARGKDSPSFDEMRFELRRRAAA